MKTGLNYYTVDTDRYLDRRIKRLRKAMGCNGLAVYDYILCEIYRDRGCGLEWDEETAFDVADYFGLKESLVMEIVRYCGAVGLFNKELLTRGIVTSASIQKRYLEMCNRARRTEVVIPEDWRLLDENSEETPKITEETRRITEETRKITEVFDKEKKSKVKERKEEVEEKPTPTPTPASENVSGVLIPSADLAEHMKADTRWLSAVSANTSTPIDTLKMLLTDFGKQVAMTEDVKELVDARRHFLAWMRKRKQAPVGRPTDGGRPYRLMTYAEMVAQAQREGKNTDGYVAIRVRGKEKPMWVTKADKELYQIPDEL